MNRSSLFTDLRGLVGKSAVYGAGSILLRALGFFLLPVYTRYMSPADYGITGATSSVVGVLSIILPFGLHGALTRFWFNTDEMDARKRAGGTIFVVMVTFSLVVTIVLDFFGRSIFQPLFPTIAFNPYLRLAIWTAFFNALTVIPLVSFQVRELAVPYVLTSGGAALTSVACTLWLVVHERLGAYGFLLGQFAGGAIFAVPLLAIAARQIRLSFDRALAIAALSFALPLVPHALAGWILDLSDRAILTHFVSLADVGIYSVGYQIGAAMSLICAAFGNAWAPFLYRSIRSEGAGASARLSQLSTYYAMFLCFSGLGLSLLARPLLIVMTSSGFHGADVIVPWVVWGYVFSGLYIVPVNFLFWKSKTGVVPVLTVGAGLINVGLNLVLIPQFGIIAAAVATLVAYVCMLLFTWAAAQRIYPFPYEYGRIGAALVIAMSLCGLYLLIAPARSFLPDTAQRVACWLIYPALLLLFRVIAPGEIAGLRGALVSVATRRAPVAGM